MATEIMGLLFEATAAAAWLVWILPFAAALIIPAVGKFSKNTTGYVAVVFALVSALSALSLLPVILEASEIHHQINWIDVTRLAFPAQPRCLTSSETASWGRDVEAIRGSWDHIGAQSIQVTLETRLPSPKFGSSAMA